MYPLDQKWFWQLFFILLVAILAPLIVFYIVMVFAPYAIVVVLVAAVFVWVIFRSYMRWISTEKEKSQNGAGSGGESEPSK
ncbi:MAG: hypothetical protein QXU45_07970 [Candidatus Bathyarchaeia archaeon]